MRLKLPPTALTFRSEDGMNVIYSDCMPSRIFFKSAGASFWKLIPGVRSGTILEHVVPFENVYTSSHGQLRRSGDIVYYGKQALHLRRDCPETIEVYPFPRVGVPMYLVDAGNGSYFYVSQDMYEPTTESIMLFFGEGDILREVPILKRETYKRDSRNIRLQTPVGTLFFPSPYEPWRGPAKWNGNALQTCNVDDFLFDERGSSVEMTERVLLASVAD